MALRAGVAAASLGMAGVAAMQKTKKTEVDVKCADFSGDYPPAGLSAGVKALPEWIQLGCGSTEYICAERGATFSADNQPSQLPDLSNHNSFFAETMRANPGLWDKLKNKSTSLGVKFSHCIKTGVDNKGHPMIKTVGAVAGDEESYTLFRDFFDPVISDRHNGYAADAKHPTDLDVRKLSTTQIDPTGKYVLTSRCRTGRSVRGTRLPPCTTFDERREVERVVVKGLLNMTGDLAGAYFPLAGSRSYAAMPGGMSHEKEESLRSRGNLFQEPDSTLLLSSGCGRHWPDARGIFHNNAENLFVWVNEEDQMRIVSMEKGDNVKRIIERFAAATSTIQKCLKQEGYDFMHSDHLGWILTCPSNLGTGLRAGAMIKVPHFSGRKDFRAVLDRMGLQARGTAGVDSASTGGTWDISNADRLGKSEIELVNIFIEGVAQIIRWEQALEAGKNIDAEVAAVGLPKTVTIEVPFSSTRGMKLD
jgi:creatine kinase